MSQTTIDHLIINSPFDKLTAGSATLTPLDDARDFAGRAGDTKAAADYEFTW